MKALFDNFGVADKSMRYFLNLRNRRFEVVSAIRVALQFFLAPTTSKFLLSRSFKTAREGSKSYKNRNRINWRGTFNYRAGLKRLRTITSSYFSQSHDRKACWKLMNFPGVHGLLIFLVFLSTQKPGVKIRRQTRKLHSI